MRTPALVTAVCASVTVIAGAGVLATPPAREPVRPAATVTETPAPAPADTTTPTTPATSAGPVAPVAPVVSGCVMFCRATEFDGSAR
ncbi:hypothetical protein ACTD5D_31755 [Nocardia takedensis]|uniref:hypothetical protein n=1 Tax=Nocardia takedensis TaxID=259390 RepID=UPI0012F68303|nr:hypothetical protein [Nocardia takedensis]